jgi:hypothetical protein
MESNLGKQIVVSICVDLHYLIRFFPLLSLSLKFSCSHRFEFAHKVIRID